MDDLATASDVAPEPSRDRAANPHPGLDLRDRRLDRDPAGARGRRDGLAVGPLGADQGRPVRLHRRGLIFQSGQTIFAGLSYYGILRAAYPGQVCSGRSSRLRRRRGDERVPAREHRHVRDPDHVRRDHPGRDRAAGRSPPTWCRRSSSRHRRVRLLVPLPLGAGLVRREPREPLGAPGRLDRDRRAAASCSLLVGRILWRQIKKLWLQAKQGGVILSRPKEYMTAGLSALVLVMAVQARRDRDLPGGVRDPGHVRVDDVGRRLRLARERRLVHARRGRDHAGDERARARDLLRRRERHGDRLLDGTAADHDSLERVFARSFSS